MIVRKILIVLFILIITGSGEVFAYLGQVFSESKEDLINAVIDNDIVKTRELLGSRVSLNIIDKEQKLTPLMVATKYGNIEMMKFLIERGADVNQCVECPFDRPVYIACCGGTTEAFRLLIEKGAVVKPSYFPECNCHDYEHAPEKYKLVFDYYEEWKKTHIYERISLEDLKKYLEKGADPNEENLIAKWADRGDIERVKLLLSYGANPNVTIYQRHSPLMLAAYKGNTELAKLLLDNGADINHIGGEGDDSNALWEAIIAWKTNDEMIRLLLSYKPDLSKLSDVNELYKKISKKEVDEIINGDK